MKFKEKKDNIVYLYASIADKDTVYTLSEMFDACFNS